jgi:hypothetical protein
MALHARAPLTDCEIAHDLLEKEKESKNWRVYWVSCLTLLRAVGHVLDKVDGQVDEKHRAIIDARWANWKANEKENAVFWNFIEAERNNLLKQYEFGVEPEPIYIVTNEGERIVTNDGEDVVLEDDFFRLSLAGFEDQEGRDIISEAIDWWHAQLDEIESQLAANTA